MVDNKSSNLSHSFRKLQVSIIKFLRRRWWGVVLLVGVVLALGYEYHWFLPAIPPPFDVDAFLAPEYFQKDRAPTAYQKVIPKLKQLDESILEAHLYLANPNFYVNVFKKPKPKVEPGKLLAASEKIAKGLIEAGKLAPGAWLDQRVSLIYKTETEYVRKSAQLLSGRSVMLLDRGKPKEALQEIIAGLELGRHYAFRGEGLQTFHGTGIEWISLDAFSRWAEHENVSPDMILQALVQIREIHPARQTISAMLQGEYPVHVNEFFKRGSFVAGVYRDSSDVRLFSKKVALRSSGPTSLKILNAVLIDRLSWCETPPWERREWVYTISGPSHLTPDVPGTKVTRNHLDASIYRSKILSSVVSSIKRKVNSYDQMTAKYALVETGTALIAYRKRIGSYPERLKELVPDYLPKLPIDPYSGKPLKLAIAREEMFAEVDPGDSEEELQEAVIFANQKVLYSIGERKLFMGDPGWLHEDLIHWNVYPLPMIEKK